jgi:dienelactone hydrolase
MVLKVAKVSLVFCVFATPLIAFAVRAQANAEPKTGVFTAEFTEKSPYADPQIIAKRMRLREGTKVPEYKLADHEFQLMVPKDYDGTQAYGLLVFIHPNNDVSLDRFFGRTIKDVLAKHKLIWVSFSDAGNPVLSATRLGVALDAAHNVQQRYRIDDERVYVSGMSGGGRMSCMAGIYYPDVFTGAIPIVGTLYFRDVTVPDDPALRALIRPEPAEGNRVWPRALIEPRAKQLREMQASQRWVLLAGEKDFNMPQMRAHFEQGFERDQFEHAHYLEVPGMAHAYPDAGWFEKAVVLLDKPLAEQAAENQAPVDERTQRLAQRRLEVALRALERDHDRGVRALEKLVEELPNTDAAQQAREKLDALDPECSTAAP